MIKDLVTIKKASKMLKVSAQTLKRWEIKGKLKSVRHPINNYRLYRISELKNILKEFENL